jgi:hypothetical protein
MIDGKLSDGLDMLSEHSIEVRTSLEFGSSYRTAIIPFLV